MPEPMITTSVLEWTGSEVEAARQSKLDRDRCRRKAEEGRRRSRLGRRESMWPTGGLRLRAGLLGRDR